MNENYLVLNGKRIDLTEEQLKALGIVTKKNPFERVTTKTEPYYYIDALDCIQTVVDNKEEDDNTSFEIGNYFNDEAMAQQVRLHQLLYRKLLKFSYDNGFEDIEWNNLNDHWYIFYNYAGCCFDCRRNDGCKSQNVYFSSEEAAERAIKEVVRPFMKEHPEFVW